MRVDFCSRYRQYVVMTDGSARTTDVAALAVDYGERLIVGTVRDVHAAVAKRTFRATRLVGGRLPESLHDGIVTSVYGAISGGMRISSGTLRTLGAHGFGHRLERSERGRLTMAVINGLIGDELRMLDDPQAIRIGIRMHGEDVPATRFPLKQAFPEATGHLAVFLHGLCESDESWKQRTASVGSNYASRIAAETDGTPVMVRYNTGLHVSENGQHLDALLEQLVQVWPEPVTRITLIGHSMGGLVARAATNYGTAANALWPKLATDIVCLGTPHTGARLEKVAHIGSRILNFWPTTKPFGGILDARSAGIVDLRHGYISKDEWEGQDLTSQWGLDRIAAAPLVHAEYHFVASTLGATRNHPYSAVLGDLMVHFSSATGVGRHGPVVEGAHFEYVPGINHFWLLNHPQIGDWIVGWLGTKNSKPAALTASPIATGPTATGKSS